MTSDLKLIEPGHVWQDHNRDRVATIAAAHSGNVIFSMTEGGKPQNRINAREGAQVPPGALFYWVSEEYFRSRYRW